MLVPDPPAAPSDAPAQAPPLFEGLMSHASRSTLARAGFVSFTPSSDAEIAAYLQGFGHLWTRTGDGIAPDPSAVLHQMGQREHQLLALWRRALRHDVGSADLPLVIQAPVRHTPNPLVLRSSALQRPLVMMSEGLWSFVSAAALGVLLWAEGTGAQEAVGQRLFMAAATGWVTRAPEQEPRGTAMAEAATLHLDLSTWAVGLADAAFTWAFLHEMGHLALGHLPASEVVRGMSADGRSTATSLSYAQRDELAADAFGFARYLGLMPLADEIRQNFHFGPQIDHAPLVMFELMDLACRVTGAQALLASPTHPAPLDRVRHLRRLHGAALSAEGCEWHAYWSERLAAFGRAVLDDTPHRGPG